MEVAEGWEAGTALGAQDAEQLLLTAWHWDQAALWVPGWGKHLKVAVYSFCEQKPSNFVQNPGAAKDRATQQEH